MMTGRTTAIIVLGAVALAVGAILVFGAIGPIGEYRDADGYYMSDPLTVDRPTSAVITNDMELLRGRYGTLTESSVVLAFVADPDDVRMHGTASGPEALFIGIAPTGAVEAYLSGVAHDEVTDWDTDLGAIVDVDYTAHSGAAPPGPPAAEAFWVTSAAGTGAQSLDWTIVPGEWTAVIMNADASPGVMAELAFGAAPSANIEAIVRTTLTIGLIAIVIGGLLLFFGIRRSTRDTRTGTAASPDMRAATEDEALTERSTTTR